MMEALDIFDDTSCGSESVRNSLPHFKSINGFGKNLINMQMLPPGHRSQKPLALITETSCSKKVMDAFTAGN